MTPAASVILPFCNQAEYAGTIVRGHVAALTQAGIGHEIILVPNGSTDDTNAVCRPMLRKLSSDRK